ncbi:enoyl-CoA hydratase [Desulfosarcina cetonica]|uniref:enoyl-CoA hydratase/isomerase family protein n=1 Tax=Desulfosarcina cetonica TaxID=90730 RepID=UPI0006D2A1A2|nr:enoyl-CoA hydratase-related protein [Desulfosarcina cetonica]
MKNFKFINIEIDTSIALVTLNRPPVNALNHQFEEEIDTIFDDLDKMPDVRVVIITGAGNKAFMAGADIKEIISFDENNAIQMSAGSQKVFNKIESSEKIIIAAINGLALGGGCELSIACDIRVADETALFGFPEVKLGLMPGAGGTQRLTRLVGVGNAKKMILTGNPITAQIAYEIGLIEQVCQKGDCVKEAQKIAKQIVSNGPLAIVNSKKAINKGLETIFEDGLRMETKLFSDLFNTEDRKEGINAFLEKRKPEFKNK